MKSLNVEENSDEILRLIKLSRKKKKLQVMSERGEKSEQKNAKSLLIKINKKIKKL